VALCAGVWLQGRRRSVGVGVPTQSVGTINTTQVPRTAQSIGRRNTVRCNGFRRVAISEAHCTKCLSVRSVLRRFDCTLHRLQFLNQTRRYPQPAKASQPQAQPYRHDEYIPALPAKFCFRLMSLGFGGLRLRLTRPTKTT